MKKIYLVLATLIGISLQVNAQCGLATPDQSCTVSPAYPKTCPDDNLPDGIAGQPYTADITMWFPNVFFEPSAGLDVTMNTVTINAVSGMPFGFTYTANPSTVTPSQNEFAAIRICGTPFNAGDYTVTISITVQASAFGISQTVNQNIPIALRINPSTAGNVAFTINNPSGCTPLPSAFTTNFPSNGNPGYSYFWDLGNGFSTLQETIPPVDYTAPNGNDTFYVIEHSVSIDTIGFYLEAVQVTNVSCTDNPGNNPDAYLRIFDGLGQEVFNTSSSTIQGNPPFNWTMNLQLTQPPYKIQVWDQDGGLLGADDNCADNAEGSNAGITLVLPTTNGVSTQIGTVGGLILNYTINHPVIEISGSDTIFVYPNPVAPVMTGDVSFCPGTNGAQLISTPEYQYQWYRADTIQPNATQQVFYATLPGNYVVQVTNQFGCSTSSDTTYVTQYPAPQQPAIFYAGGLVQTDLTTPAFQLQWFYEGFAFAGQTGQTCVPIFDGSYFVRAENSFGCYSYSDTIEVTKVGVNELATNALDFTIMPNPATGNATVFVDGTATGPVNLTIYNVMGSVVSQKQLNVTKGVVSKHAETIDISNLAQGIYNATFRFGNQQKVLKLFVY
ncbi:MAG: T9SS type A sorting domain-containing protein [Sphingobacteriales bacterium JAD_PAG50586_3]|nr:MAG: T9SS type A sorting domain-containing protein [Sphingobacteriales bacterium JAD_PAG50586_3]